MKGQRKQITKEKDKLNWLEKIAVKKMFNKVKKDLDKWKSQIKENKEKKKEEKTKEENDKFETELKSRITKSIIEMKDMFTLENDDGTPITEADLLTKSIDELIKLMQDIIKETENLLR